MTPTPAAPDAAPDAARVTVVAAAVPPREGRIERQLSGIAVSAVAVLAYAWIARTFAWHALAGTTAQALLCGAGAAVLAGLRARPRLRAVWAETTFLVGCALFLVHVWNGFWRGEPWWLQIADGALAAAFVAGAGRLARRARVGLG